MPIPEQYQGRHIYHFTHIDNLPDILQHGLLSYNEKKRRGIQHVSIAANSIQQRRAAMRVTVPPGGVVHDYVPFYFGSLSPMLLAVINKKNVDQYNIIFIGVSIDILGYEGTVFTNAAANANTPPTFYIDLDDLDNLDWDNINSRSWGNPSEEAKRARMAEALIQTRVNVSDFDHIIVWNQPLREKVEEIYADADIPPPSIHYAPYRSRSFYYTNFYENGPDYSIITGPENLLNAFRSAVVGVIDKRKEDSPSTPAFDNVEDAVEKVNDDFCVLPELEAINNLETANPEHREGVGAHIRTVVAKLINSDYCSNLSAHKRALLLFAAYLHDIGKGQSPRDNGRQRTDNDHPARAIPLVQRILTQEFNEITEEEIRQILLLVAYHDLVGDIIGKDRDRNQLLDVVESAEDFDMLAALTCADVESLIPEDAFARMLSSATTWLRDIKTALSGLREWVLENIEEDE